MPTTTPNPFQRVKVEKYTEQINLMLTPTQLEKLRETALRLECSVSEFIRDAISLALESGAAGNTK